MTSPLRESIDWSMDFDKSSLLSAYDFDSFSTLKTKAMTKDTTSLNSPYNDQSIKVLSGAIIKQRKNSVTPKKRRVRRLNSIECPKQTTPSPMIHKREGRIILTPENIDAGNLNHSPWKLHRTPGKNCIRKTYKSATKKQQKYYEPSKKIQRNPAGTGKLNNNKKNIEKDVDLSYKVKGNKFRNRAGISIEVPANQRRNRNVVYDQYNFSILVDEVFEKGGKNGGMMTLNEFREAQKAEKLKASKVDNVIDLRYELEGSRKNSQVSLENDMPLAYTHSSPDNEGSHSSASEAEEMFSRRDLKRIHQERKYTVRSKVKIKKEKLKSNEKITNNKSVPRIKSIEEVSISLIKN